MGLDVDAEEGKADGEEKTNSSPVAPAQHVVPCYHGITVSATSDMCSAISSLTSQPLPPPSPAALPPLPLLTHNPDLHGFQKQEQE